MYPYESKQLKALYHFEIQNKEPHQTRNKNGRYKQFIHNNQEGCGKLYRTAMITDDQSTINTRIALTLVRELLKIRAHFCQLRFGVFAKTQVTLVNISTGRMKL